VSRTGRLAAAGEVPDRAVDHHRLTRVGQVPGPLQEQQLAPGELCYPFTSLPRLAAVQATVDGQDGTAHPGQGGLGVLLAGRRERRVHEEQVRRGRGFQGPAHAVLALLGRVRLGEHLAEEELEVPRPVAQHVVPVDLGPALLGGENLVEVI
jgi:hypothetical protein